MSQQQLQLPAEKQYAHEIEALKKEETHPLPPGWQLSPHSVLMYLLGGQAGGVTIIPKYLGHRRLIEIAIATLLTDRALLLVGDPGTGKSWLSEHMAAAIHNDSGKVIQGTAGTTEDQVRYSWNYAMLIARGPSSEALVPSPVYSAMATGTLVRFEEISRCSSDVQDALISILSEKRLAIHELKEELAALQGFSLIATANSRDRGVNDMSAALKRRFNVVVLPSPGDLETEVAIVKKRVSEMAIQLEMRGSMPADEAVEQVVTVFRELRNGVTMDGRNKVTSPENVPSTAEAISLLTGSMALASSFSQGIVTPDDLAAGLQGAIVKDEDKDQTTWQEYLENIMKRRGKSWESLYQACRKMNQ